LTQGSSASDTGAPSFGGFAKPAWAAGYDRGVAGRNALFVVDMQRAFEDLDYWGHRNNRDCERNVGALIEAWREAAQPVVFVRHDSLEESPLRPGEPGNAFKEVIDGSPDLLVTKHVNSAFHGDPDLAEWLRRNEIDAFTVCGIQTNMCCETTARVGANLGFEMRFVLDATHTFDLQDRDGAMISADELTRVTAANLDPEFGEVVSTEDAVAKLKG
jgi:nicotinamidase-related amidase